MNSILLGGNDAQCWAITGLPAKPSFFYGWAQQLAPARAAVGQLCRSDSHFFHTDQPQDPTAARLKLGTANAPFGVNIAPCRVVLHDKDNALPVDLVEHPLHRFSIAAGLC